MNQIDLLIVRRYQRNLPSLIFWVISIYTSGYVWILGLIGRLRELTAEDQINGVENMMYIQSSASTRCCNRYVLL